MVGTLSRWVMTIALAVSAALLLASCGPAQTARPEPASQGETGAGSHAADPEMPVLVAATLEQGEKLRVAATTGIVADVVANVGGDAIELTPLLPVGADPHSYTPTPQDLRALNDAHVIFVNGLGLEESLLPILENLDRPAPLVSVNLGVDTLQLDHEEASGHDGGEDDHAGGADPHTWFSVPNVMVWTDNIATALAAMDTARAEEYRAAAASYQGELRTLDVELRSQIDALPAEQRKLVTDHVALGYLAAEYGFETVGSVVPSLSTLAAASAQELAALQEAMAAEGVAALFVSTTVNTQTAAQLANDLGIPVVELYTGSLSDAAGPAATYLELMRYDLARIVEALQ